MAKSRFPDVAGILEAIEADATGLSRWDQSNGQLPAEVPDHERKYLANGLALPLGMRKLQFQALMYKLCDGPRAPFRLIKSENFAGVDEMFELRGKSLTAEVLTHRLRFGSNRPCQWTTKVRQPGRGMEDRTYSSVSIPYKDLRGARASLLRTSKMAPHSKHVFIGQSGEFWFVEDKSGYVVEIVLYKAGRAEPDATSPLKLLVEIAPRGCPSAEVAVEVMQRCESLLHLARRQVKMSNMELFRTK